MPRLSPLCRRPTAGSAAGCGRDRPAIVDPRDRATTQNPWSKEPPVRLAETPAISSQRSVATNEIDSGRRTLRKEVTLGVGGALRLRWPAAEPAGRALGQRR